MTREITPAVEAESEKSIVSPFYALLLDLPSGPSCSSSLPFSVTFESGAAGFGVLEFLGVGNLGAFTNIKETIELGANDVTLELSGVPVENIAAALNEPYQRRKAFIWRGYVDDAYAVIPDPAIVYRGLIDTMDIRRGQKAVITVRLTSRFATWEEPRIRRYTDADQQARHPGDKFFEFGSEMTEKEFDW